MVASFYWSLIQMCIRDRYIPHFRVGGAYSAIGTVEELWAGRERSHEVADRRTLHLPRGASPFPRPRSRRCWWKESAVPDPVHIQDAINASHQKNGWRRGSGGRFPELSSRTEYRRGTRHRQAWRHTGAALASERLRVAVLYRWKRSHDCFLPSGKCAYDGLPRQRCWLHSSCRGPLRREHRRYRSGIPGNVQGERVSGLLLE